jgi:hypothetical protein
MSTVCLLQATRCAWPKRVRIGNRYTIGCGRQGEVFMSLLTGNSTRRIVYFQDLINY